MITNDEIIILDDSLMMINSKVCTNICPSHYLQKYILRPRKLNLTMYDGISSDPNNYLLLQYSNNLYTQYLQWTSNEDFMVLWLRALTIDNI